MQWDQMEGEPSDAYAHFLVYRNLGPARTVDDSYNAAFPVAPKKVAPKARSRRPEAKPLRASSTWWRESRDYEWKERASAWDIHMLVNTVPEAMVSIMHTVNEFAKSSLRAVQSGKIQPKNFGELLAGVQLMASFISAETISAILAQRAGYEPALPPAGEAETIVGATTGAADGSPRQ